MSEVRVGENESFENALKRFKRQCARNGVIAEVRKREHYMKPSVKRKKRAKPPARPPTRPPASVGADNLHKAIQIQYSQMCWILFCHHRADRCAREPVSPRFLNFCDGKGIRTTPSNTYAVWTNGYMRVSARTYTTKGGNGNV